MVNGDIPRFLAKGDAPRFREPFCGSRDSRSE
jgi:hypothetical protein